MFELTGRTALVKRTSQADARHSISLQADATGDKERQTVEHLWKHPAASSSPQLLRPVWLREIPPSVYGTEGCVFEPHGVRFSDS